MNKPRILSAALSVLAGLGASGLALADRHEHERHHRQYDSYARTAALADPAAAERYRSECGACHIAYPPGMLLTFTWAEIMNKLDAHYGDDASLDPETVGRVLGYLASKAADQDGGVRAGAFATAPMSDTELPRLTATRFFRSEHREIPERLVAGNPEVKSFSACQACHAAAEQGRFDEDDVRIPGVGRFADRPLGNDQPAAAKLTKP